MNILIVCQHYWPEPFNTSDVCEELVKRGHSVTALTGLPNTGMPNSDIPYEYRNGKNRVQKRNGVTILRADLAPRKTGAANRVKNYLSFWLNANKLARNIKDEFDVVLGYQFSPVMQVDPGLVYAKKHHKKMLLYCFDLWPISLTAGGFSQESLPYKWMSSVSRRIYSRADRIAVTSPLFDEYFSGSLSLNREPSAYLPQYADDNFGTVGTSGGCDGYDPTKINLTFAGNVGQAQSVATIVRAASLCNNDRIVVHVVGSGSRLEDCKRLAETLKAKNVVFHGRKPIEEMPRYYAASSAMLVTFEDSPMATYTLPRKVTTYLAAGKPVLAALSGETKRVIDEAHCGLCCAIEDAEGLARICDEFVERDDKELMGKNARSYYESHFSKEMFFDKLESILKELAGENNNG